MTYVKCVKIKVVGNNIEQYTLVDSTGYVFTVNSEEELQQCILNKTLFVVNLKVLPGKGIIERTQGEIEEAKKNLSVFASIKKGMLDLEKWLKDRGVRTSLQDSTLSISFGLGVDLVISSTNTLKNKDSNIVELKLKEVDDRVYYPKELVKSVVSELEENIEMYIKQVKFKYDKNSWLYHTKQILELVLSNIETKQLEFGLNYFKDVDMSISYEL